MTPPQQSWILNTVKEITIAKVSNSNEAACKESGEDISEFMDTVFDGLCEIVKKFDSLN